MPSRFRLRKPFAPLVRFVARILIKIGFTPNAATFTMLLFAIGSFIALVVYENLLLYSVLVFTTGILDGVDGAIARITGKGSQFGAFLDSTMDRLSEPFIYLPLFFKGRLLLTPNEEINFTLIAFLITFSFLISYTRARFEIEARKKEKKADTNVGLLGRSERLFFLVILSFITFFLRTYEVKFWHTFFFIAILIFTTLVFLTFLYRIIYYKKEAQRLQL